MCERSDKCILWLDHELPEDEAGDVRLHVQTCAECRRRLAAYRNISAAIGGYCDAAIESYARASVSTWTSMLAAAAAVVLLVVANGHVARERGQRPVSSATVTAMSSPALAQHNKGQANVRAVVAVPPTPAHKRSRTIPKVSVVRDGGSAQQTQNLNPTGNASWIPAPAAVEIAIPAEAMFAPGALPQGVSFRAELVIAADGSAQQLRLHP